MSSCRYRVRASGPRVSTTIIGHRRGSGQGAGARGPTRRGYRQAAHVGVGVPRRVPAPRRAKRLSQYAAPPRERPPRRPGSQAPQEREALSTRGSATRAHPSRTDGTRPHRASGLCQYAAPPHRRTPHGPAQPDPTGPRQHATPPHRHTPNGPAQPGPIGARGTARPAPTDPHPLNAPKPPTPINPFPIHPIEHRRRSDPGPPQRSARPGRRPISCARSTVLTRSRVPSFR